MCAGEKMNTEANVVKALRNLTAEEREVVKTILTRITPGQIDTLFFILDRESVTALTVMKDVNKPEATVYRILKELRLLNLIEKGTEIHTNGSIGGPHPVLWSVPDSSSHSIVEAIGRHKELVAQRTLERKQEKLARLGQTPLRDQIRREPRTQKKTRS